MGTNDQRAGTPLPPATGLRRESSRCAPATRRRTCWTRPTSPPPTGAGSTPARPGAAPTPCRAANGCSCRCAPAAARSAWSGIDRDAPATPLTPEQRRLLDALTDQAALAIERARLAEDLDRARLAAETDRLRAALLTSISHDLRTPLASILGSASSLVADADRLEPGARRGLIRTIQEEAERLNRFIGNLLDMTRLEVGAR